MKASRRTIIAGNWKMNLSPGEAIAYFGDLQAKNPPIANAKTRSQILFPVAYCLTPHVEQAATAAHITLGAQNIHWEEKGAFTGELSGAGIKACGIHWCLIAHSERRQYFNETDETAAKRLASALKQDFNIVYCIGERLEEREANQTEAVLKRQLKPFAEALKASGRAGKVNEPGASSAQVLSIAYEPVWAIGTGRTATNAQAEDAHKFIRKTLTELVGSEFAQTLPILYGGSVTAENAEGLLKEANIDGVLVGGASLKPESFARILVARAPE